MTLSDVLTQLRGTTDQTHKFWGYYQTFTPAAILFAWSTSKPPSGMIICLAIVYAIFALLNCRLVVASQKAALAIWQAIQEHRANPPAPIAPAFASVLGLNQPDDPKIIGAAHLAMSVAAFLAILSKHWFQN